MPCSAMPCCAVLCRAEGHTCHSVLLLAAALAAPMTSLCVQEYRCCVPMLQHRHCIGMLSQVAEHLLFKGNV